jgi:hypothetical protein
MDYFLLKQDERYKDVPVISQLSSKIGMFQMKHQDIKKLEDKIVFNVNMASENDWPDIIDRQLFIVSDGLKKIIEKYLPDSVFKTLVLIDTGNKKQEKYFLPMFEKVDALSPKCEFTRDKSIITKLVLKKDNLKEKKIFTVTDGLKPTVIVRLDAAESILRRYFKGVYLERVPMED